VLVNTLSHIKSAVLHLFYPNICVGCNNPKIALQQVVCTNCLAVLPVTNINNGAQSVTEKMFWGRVPLEKAWSMWYFNKSSVVQNAIHALKYKERQDVGIWIGEAMGNLYNEHISNKVDIIVPLPLHFRKESKRGYNQSAVIAKGFSAVTNIPVIQTGAVRLNHTATQTNKTRAERWNNMEGVFMVANQSELENKHILLLDDIVTTGATLEACAKSLLQVKGCRLSIATAAVVE
jgi:ComF family protein